MNDFENNLNHLLVNTFNYITKYEELSLKSIYAVPVTVSEAHIIENISKNSDGVNVSSLASSLNISMPTVTVALKKLEAKGFITKNPCAVDGRRSIISLTETGERVNKAHSLFHERMVKNISRKFSDLEKDVLLSAINTLSEFFKEKVEA